MEFASFVFLQTILLEFYNKFQVSPLLSNTSYSLLTSTTSLLIYQPPISNFDARLFYQSANLSTRLFVK